jgi:hypothetical protein
MREPTPPSIGIAVALVVITALALWLLGGRFYRGLNWRPGVERARWTGCTVGSAGELTRVELRPEHCGAFFPFLDLEDLAARAGPALEDFSLAIGSYARGDVALLAARCPRLRSIDMRNCHRVCGRLESLAALGDLRELDLRGTACQGSLSGLLAPRAEHTGTHRTPKLSHLYLQRGVGLLGDLASCRRLQVLSLSGANFRGGLEQLLPHLPSLAELYLSWTNCTGDIKVTRSNPARPLRTSYN